MKKTFRIALLAIISVLVAVAFAACEGKYSEVAGTYEMTSISGSIYGVPVSTSDYEYYTLILKANGDAKVKSKGSATGSVAYESNATFTYENGVINIITKSGNTSVTEVMNYENGVIIYEINNSQMNLYIIFEKK